jgi:hypothetical protein
LASVVAVLQANEVRSSKLLGRQWYGNAPEYWVGIITIGLSASLLFAVK